MKCPQCGCENDDQAMHCGSCYEAFQKEWGVVCDDDVRPPKCLAWTGAVLAAGWNGVFVAIWSLDGTKHALPLGLVTTPIVGWVGYTLGKSLAKEFTAGMAVIFGFVGGVVVGVINGTTIMPIIGSIVGGVIGAVIGPVSGLALFLVAAVFGRRR